MYHEPFAVHFSIQIHSIGIQGQRVETPCSCDDVPVSSSPFVNVQTSNPQRTAKVELTLFFLFSNSITQSHERIARAKNKKKRTRVSPRISTKGLARESPAEAVTDNNPAVAKRLDSTINIISKDCIQVL